MVLLSSTEFFAELRAGEQANEGKKSKQNKKFGKPIQA
jgi:hypothetical protein